MAQDEELVFEKRPNDDGVVREFAVATSTCHYCGDTKEVLRPVIRVSDKDYQKLDGELLPATKKVADMTAFRIIVSVILLVLSMIVVSLVNFSIETVPLVLLAFCNIGVVALFVTTLSSTAQEKADQLLERAVRFVSRQQIQKREEIWNQIREITGVDSDNIGTLSSDHQGYHLVVPEDY